MSIGLIRQGGKLVILGIVSLLALILFASMWLFGWGFWSMGTADFRGQVAQTERIHADPNYRIANYDWFFSQCGAVQSQEANIRNLEEEKETATEGRIQQINATLTAVRNNRDSLINEYNARANQEETAANFLASTLPPQLSSESEKTECVVDPSEYSLP